MDRGDPSDAELTRLMIAAQGGDKIRYAELLKGSVAIISTAARRDGAGDILVDAVVGETLLTLHNARHTYDPTRSFTVWLTAISQRCAADLLRRHSRQTRRKTGTPLLLNRERRDQGRRASSGWFWV